MTVVADIESERAALTKSLTAVGPSAPTACGSWTALDLAAHLVSEERSGGVVVFLGRTMAIRGITVSDPKGIERLIRRERRHGYGALVDRLRQPPPRLLVRPSIAAVTLFELWMHHDDLARPNGLDHDVPTHLHEVMPTLLRYQARRLPADVRLTVATGAAGQQWTLGPDAGAAVLAHGSAGDLVRWLAGRVPLTRLALDGQTDAVRAVRAFPGHV